MALTNEKPDPRPQIATKSMAQTKEIETHAVFIRALNCRKIKECSPLK